jgi:hypothetical protein
MVDTLFSGMVPTADQLNEIAKVGAKAASVSATSDSATFASATKVLLGLTASFTAPALAIYEVTAVFTWSCSVADDQAAFAVVWKQGTVAATDAVAGASGPRSTTVATGFNNCTVLGEFTTASAGTHEVALIGWMPTGDTGTCKLEGDPNFAINRLTVRRVG